MKALRYLGQKKHEVIELPTPVIKENEVLVKVKACGICGSDIHGYLGLTGRRLAPMTQGHEFSGEIVERGKKVTKFNIGNRVVVQPCFFCGECLYCKLDYTSVCVNKRFFGVFDIDGALAEYIAVPEKLLFSLSDKCTYEEGALIEPYSVAYASIKKVGLGELKDKIVLIIGAGTIGLSILQLVKLQEPKIIIVSDLSDVRLNKAKDIGADYTINPKREDYMKTVNSITEGEMVDVSFEAVGIQATANQAIKCLKSFGKAVWVGLSQNQIEINMQDVVASARSVLGSYIYTHSEFGEMVEILSRGELNTKQLITKVITLEESVDMFDDIYSYPDKYIKVIVDPSK